MKRYWLAICLLALVLRIVFVWQVRAIYQAHPDDPWLQGGAPSAKFDERWNQQRGYALRAGYDMAKHVRYGRMVLAGQWLAENGTISPLAPLLVLPLCLLLGGGAVQGAMMVHAILGVAVLFLLGRIGLRFVSERAALLAMLLGAVYVPFIIYDGLPLTETTINLFCFASILSYLRLREAPGLKRALVWGAIVGLATAAKPTLLILFVLLPLGDALERGRPGWRLLWNGLGLGALAAVLLCIAPFVYRVHCLTGEWLFLRGNTGYMVLMGNHKGATGSFVQLPPSLEKRLQVESGGTLGGRDRVALRFSLAWWLEEPVPAALLFLKKTYKLLSPKEEANNVSLLYLRQISFLAFPCWLTSPWLWGFALAGGASLWRQRKRWWLLVVVFAGYSLLIVMTIVLTRLRLPLLLLPFLLAGAGLEWLYGRGGGLDRRRLLAFVGVLFFAFFWHRDGIARQILPLVQPVPAPRPNQGTLLYGDTDWQRVVKKEPPYGVVLFGRGEWLEKDIVLPRSLKPGQPSLQIRGHAKGKGILHLSVGGISHAVQIPVRPLAIPMSRMYTIRVPLPGLETKELFTFRLAPGPGTTLRIALSDGLWYHRTRVMKEGKRLPRPFFDPITLQYRRHAHLPRGEAAVSLCVEP